MTPPINEAAKTAGGAARTRLRYLDYFRGVAILQIVILHAGRALFNRGFGDPVPDSHPAFATVDIFFHNATIYFTLISSIVYAYLFSKRDFVDFLRSRAFYVATPYLLVSAGLTILLSLRAGSPDAASLAADLFRNAVTGDAWNQLWYIPVILILYVLTPTLFALTRAPGAGPVLLALIMAPFLFSRTGTVVTTSTVLYFLGPYVLGLMIGSDLEGWMRRLERLVPHLAAIAVATTAALYQLYFSGIDFVGLVSLREGLFYAQKLALAGLMLVWLRGWERRPVKWRDALIGFAAATAFPIYFIHAPALRPIAQAIGPAMPVEPGFLGWVAAILAASVVALLVSWTITILSQKLLGSRSRFLLGA